MIAAWVIAAVGWLTAAAAIVAWNRSRAHTRRAVVSRVTTDAVQQRDVSEQLEQLRLTLDGLDEAVVLASSDGTVRLRNLRAHAPTGTRHGDALVNDALLRQIAAALATGQPTRGEPVAMHDAAQRVFHVSAVPLRTGSGAVATVVDVSERMRLDAVRTDFVTNISHELKTPVGAMIVLAETLSQEDDPAVIQRLSNKVVRESERLSGMIDELLELSRIELGYQMQVDPVPVGQIVAGALTRATPGAERRQVTLDAQAAVIDSTIVMGDRHQLVSAVANLIDNAVKYSESGGRVTVSIAREGADALISVADNGIGIAPHHIERIFERFYRVDRARSRETGGTGLGLAVVRHVVRNHHGDVTVESSEGVGSTFTLRLPAREDS